jgi:hypothetical protein
MIDQLIEIAMTQGIWCVLCIYLIVQQNRKLTKLENWVQEKVLVALDDNTKALNTFKEAIDANKDRR